MELMLVERLFPFGNDNRNYSIADQIGWHQAFRHQSMRAMGGSW
jgi:hypothetical protein